MVVRGRRHESLRHLADELVQTTLVQQDAFTRGERRDLAEDAAEGSGERTLTLGPRATVARHDQGSDDLAVEQLNGVDEDSPFDVVNHARERAERLLAGELGFDAFADAFKRALRLRPDQWFEVEARHRATRSGDHGDDFGSRGHLAQRLHDESRFSADSHGIGVPEICHGETASSAIWSEIRE